MIVGDEVWERPLFFFFSRKKDKKIEYSNYILRVLKAITETVFLTASQEDIPAPEVICCKQVEAFRPEIRKIK